MADAVQNDLYALEGWNGHAVDVEAVHFAEVWRSFAILIRTYRTIVSLVRCFGPDLIMK